MLKVEMGKITRNGRSKDRFVKLDHWIFQSPAYRALRPVSRALLWELIYRYNSFNNGRIGLSVREAAKACNVNKDTLARYFRELQNHGFIIEGKHGGFNTKDPSANRASEWTLTWQPADGNKATNDFKSWKPDTD